MDFREKPPQLRSQVQQGDEIELSRFERAFKKRYGDQHVLVGVQSIENGALATRLFHIFDPQVSADEKHLKFHAYELAPVHHGPLMDVATTPATEGTTGSGKLTLDTTPISGDIYTVRAFYKTGSKGYAALSFDHPIRYTLNDGGPGILTGTAGDGAPGNDYLQITSAVTPPVEFFIEINSWQGSGTIHELTPENPTLEFTPGQS